MDKWLFTWKIIILRKIVCCEWSVILLRISWISINIITALSYIRDIMWIYTGFYPAFKHTYPHSFARSLIKLEQINPVRLTCGSSGISWLNDVISKYSNVCCLVRSIVDPMLSLHRRKCHILNCPNQQHQSALEKDQASVVRFVLIMVEGYQGDHPHRGLM